MWKHIDVASNSKQQKPTAMTPLELIILILIFQTITYAFVWRGTLRKWSFITPVILVPVYLFFIPSYFFPANPDKEPMCGMPAFAITMIFWFAGAGTTMFTHVIYLLVRQRRRPGNL